MVRWYSNLFISFCILTPVILIIIQIVFLMNLSVKVKEKHVDAQIKCECLLFDYSQLLCSCSCVRLFTAPWTAARQASLPFTVSRSLPRFVSIELMMPSNHYTLCRPLLLLPSNLFQCQGLFQWVAKVLELQLQHQSFQWIFRVDFL